jgi:hypothetical protein
VPSDAGDAGDVQPRDRGRNVAYRFEQYFELNLTSLAPEILFWQSGLSAWVVTVNLNKGERDV